MALDRSMPEAWPFCLTACQAAEITGLSDATIYEMVRRRELPARRKGRRVIILREDLLAWLRGELEPEQQLRLFGGRR